MQKNCKFWLSLLSLLFSFALHAQVGIGLPNPDHSAMLHISAKDKGILLPSIALTSTTDNVTVPAPADGLIVWNNGNGALQKRDFTTGIIQNGINSYPIPLKPLKVMVKAGMLPVPTWETMEVSIPICH